MSGPRAIPEFEGMRVTVDRLIYAPELPSTPEHPHSFVYFISIHNDGPVPVTIKGRKWVVTNARGEITAVEGDGVVGECPLIAPGEKFSYNSRHLLDTHHGVAEGSYLGVDASGRRGIVRIPKFELTVPDPPRGTTMWA